MMMMMMMMMRGYFRQRLRARRRDTSTRGRDRDNNIDITSLETRYFVSSATPVLVFLRTPGESGGRLCRCK